MYDDFNKIKSHLDTKLEVLQLQLNESHNSIREHLEEEYYQKYTKLENYVCNVIGTKMSTLSKQEQLQITVDYLLENNQNSIEKYEMLKIFIDFAAANKLRANKQQKSKTISIITTTSKFGSAETKTSDDDIYKEQELLNHVIHLLVESNVSVKKFCQLETLMETLAESSVSRDYMDSALRDQAKENLKYLQKISAAITSTDHKNTTLETRNTELQAFIKELKKSKRNNSVLMEKEIKMQQIIMKTVQDENNTHRMKLEKMMTKATENLNRNIVQIIHKLLAEQMP